MRLRFFGLLVLVVLTLCLCRWVRLAESNKSLVAYRIDSNSELSIYYLSTASGEERVAAEDFKNYLERVVGGSFSLVEYDPNQTQKVNYNPMGGGIYLGGMLKHLKLFDRHCARMDESYYVVSEGNSLGICGWDVASNASSMYHFLQKYCGVRWFVPGPLGEYVPKLDRVEIPRGVHEAQPAFFSRSFSGFKTEKGRKWAQRNLLDARLRFHHNLGKIWYDSQFPKRVDWLPLYRGKPYSPNGRDDYYWQPDITDSAYVTFVAESAKQHFRENTSSSSYSISLNDSFRFGEQVKSSPFWSDERFFRRRPDFSNIVFDFSNKVARKVKEVFPEKYLGCLAYYWWENTPEFEVESNLIPYLTADRSQYYDPVFKKQDMDLIQRWVQAGPDFVGVYDYSYGSSFLIPRLYNQFIGESIRFNFQEGVRAYYSELYPVWGFDGLKAWIITQLLFDPDQSLEKLENEFFEKFFEVSAEPMRRFFKICEEQWSSQSGDARWLKYRGDEAQFSLFPPEVCEELRNVLNAAYLSADNTLTVDRIKLVDDAFSVCEVYSQLYHRRLMLSRMQCDSRESIEGLLKELPEYFSVLDAWEGKRREMDDLHPLNRQLQDSKDLFKADPLPRLIISSLEWCIEHEKWDTVAEPLINLLDILNNSKINYIVSVFESERNEKDEPYNVARNRSFELPIELNEKKVPFYNVDSVVDKPLFWHVVSRPAEGLEITRIPAAAKSGSLGVQVKRCDVLKVSQKMFVDEERFYKFSCWFKGRVGNSSNVSLNLQWSGGREILDAPIIRDRMAPGEVNEWTKLLVAGIAPRGAKVASISIEVKYQEGEDFLWIDDFSAQGY